MFPAPPAEIFIPRRHQTEGVHALTHYDEGRFSVVEACVASGKSDMLGMLAKHYAQFGRVIVVAHNKELVIQNGRACKRHGINPGICSSSISTNAFARVTVGTIGSIVNRVHLFRDVVAILVDEVHMVPPAKSSQYRRLFEKLPNAKVHGLTGTPFRADGTGDLAKTFGKIVYRYTFLDALRDGYVKPLVPVDAGEDETINVEGLKTTAGDFDLDEMAPRAIKLAPSHAKTIKEVMQKYNRSRVLVFCCNIAHVDKMEAALCSLGVAAVGVHSRSIIGKRDKAVEAFRSGRAQVLVSCNMFCVDAKTEILTNEGWRTHKTILRSDKVANYHPQTRRITWHEPRDVNVSVNTPGVPFYGAEGRGHSIRVTAEHTITYENSFGAKLAAKAHELGGRRLLIPTCGVSDCEAPNITNAQCAFIGFWLGDGTRAGGRFSLSQSNKYSDTQTWVRKTLKEAGLHWTEHPHKNNAVTFSLSTGRGGKHQYRIGGVWFLEKYLNKNGYEGLRNLSRDQLLALLHGFWMADGNHHSGHGTAVIGTQKLLYDILQEVCTCRGVDTTLTALKHPADWNWKQQYRFSWDVTHSGLRTMKIKAYTPNDAEIAWCVTTESGFIVTRRQGKTAVTGNTTGFDVPDIDYEAFCRATKSAVYYAQGLGRGARITPFAANCLVSDFGGNIQRHGTLDAVMAAPGRLLECEADPCTQEWETWENGKTCPKCQTIHRSAPKCKNCNEKFDPHFHGMRCPHCGQQQSEIKTCAACEETYAAFLHPICPFCQFDNTITIAAGKDLKTRGGGEHAVDVRKLVEAAPWQEVIGPPVKNPSGGWTLTTRFTTALWPYETLPEPLSVYLKRSPNGRYVAAGLYDKNGTIHQR